MLCKVRCHLTILNLTFVLLPGQLVSDFVTGPAGCLLTLLPLAWFLLA